MFIPRDIPSKRGLKNVMEKSKSYSKASKASLDSVTPEEWDRISKPSHDESRSKKHSELECYNFIKAALTPEELKGYNKGNILSCVWRCDHEAEPLNDLRKAKAFLDSLISHVNQQ